MKNFSFNLLLSILLFALAGCGKYNDLNIHGVKEYRFRGMKDGVIFLNLTLDVENPNRKPIVIKDIHFKAWLNNRELGKLRSSHKLKIEGKSRKDYEVPLEIVLRTPADAFKLIGEGKNLINVIEVEGYIKGGKFPVVKKINIPRQPLSELANSFQKKFVITDTLSVQPAVMP
ncbi:MAG: LEA type 2 family protein [Tenuifilum sp.]|uniref:LEA type 2 family protein n=1 Tax=Tenuifilum sp. TaxID=2760880 RepID=UPI0030ABD11F